MSIGNLHITLEKPTQGATMSATTASASSIFNAPPPPPPSTHKTSLWEARDVAYALESIRADGYVGFDAPDRRSASRRAASLSRQLMRHPAWKPRAGEPLPRFCNTRTSEVDGTWYGYVIVGTSYVDPRAKDLVELDEHGVRKGRARRRKR